MTPEERAILRTNPYLRTVRAEAFPSGKGINMILCPKCGNKGLPLVNAPTQRAYATQCMKCGAVHGVKNNELSWRQVQRQGVHIPAGPVKNEGRRSEYVDATKRIQVLRRKRELGRDYWRNPD